MEPIEKITEETTAIIRKVPINEMIITQSDYDSRKHLFDSIRKRKNEIIEWFKEPIQKAHEAHKLLLARKKETLDPIEAFEAKEQKALNVYIDTQKKIREDAERKAREETEQLRKIEEDRILKEAEMAKADGASEKVIESVLEQKIYVPEPKTIIPEVPKYDARVLGKKNWKFKIIDADKIPREYLCPDMVKIGQYVRTMKADAKIEGVEAYCE